MSKALPEAKSSLIRPPHLSAYSEDSGSVPGFLNTILDRHQSALLLQAWSLGTAPREDAWQRPALLEPLGPAPGTLEFWPHLQPSLVTLDSPPPRLSFLAGASQGIRYISKLPCCLIYALTGQKGRLQSGVGQGVKAGTGVAGG